MHSALMAAVPAPPQVSTPHRPESGAIDHSAPLDIQRWRPDYAIWLVMALTVVARLPLIGAPMLSDEGGFLMLASQWHHGSSLYGNYWVDRPPLLISIFGIADQLGGSLEALRLVGTAAALASIAGAAAIGRALAGRRGAVLAATAGAILTTSPLLQGWEVDGELLALPFALWGVALILHGLAQSVVRGRAWLLAGVLGGAAPLVKQNSIDVAIFGLVMVVVLASTRRIREAAELIALLALGAMVSLGLTLTWAAWHGTSPAELWEAVVTFRGQAASLIAATQPGAISNRALWLVVAAVASGVAMLAGGALTLTRQRLPLGGTDLRLPLLAMGAWEIFGVVAGGSYWLHYLLALVPMLIIAVGALARRAHAGWLTATLTWSGLGAVAATVWLVMHPAGLDDQEAARWLSAHSEPGDTAVVAYGQPNVLRQANLTSPYPNLWSLPIRVRDPQLSQLTQALRAPNRPTFVVIKGGQLASWGLDPTAAEAALHADYRRVAWAGNFAIWRAESATATGQAH